MPWVEDYTYGCGGGLSSCRASDEGTAGYGNNPASLAGYPTYRGPSAVPPYYIFDNDAQIEPSYMRVVGKLIFNP